MEREPGIGLITKTVLHFLKIQDDRNVTLTTNEIDVKDILKVMLENDLSESCLRNKKVRIIEDTLSSLTAITFE